ncbi:bifunctional DNA-formamidopyrimidine glycosylase/DNA-(apurinic or apyrimidinic site) lyase [Arenibaculum pallidiluteum]|uniref:bifunctional DNA-formamidopyrimidine glycosylase/DNA-(apurinic or apyrimidinic site) lyase n=1 Tax=Arenibaculum pallidiluteum TaxID=2812559 RepID=UPI001A970F92|nr:bifunctional DNA-formamidopyrimidine glycosylase/DNA-(apurinic or apyrimidinic site) lyase [Arenibaculum pallidiluteum]
MPELPEVETVCRGLAPWIEGRTVTRVEQRRPDLRIPFPEGLVTRLTGRRVERVRRRAKYALMDLDDGTTVIWHLGMSGRMTVGRDLGPVLAHDHLILGFDDGAELRFNDARRFGLVTLAEPGEADRHPLLAGLGPEPLGNGFNGAVLAERLRGKLCPIKAALLDQQVVAGVGNIYACEALFRARLSPTRLAATVVGKRAEDLAAAVRAVLAEAIEAGGSSLRDYVQASGELGYFQHRFAVYDREGAACPGCTCDIARTGGIRRIIQSNRSTFYCPRRQR